MDPDANIAAQRRLIDQIHASPGDTDALAELAELTSALTDWLAAGGFFPDAPGWARTVTEAFQILARHAEVTTRDGHTVFRRVTAESGELP